MTAAKTDAEGKIDDIRIKLTDTPDCCAGCWWQIVDGMIVCCGCGDPLNVEREDY